MNSAHITDFVNTVDLRPYAEGLSSPEALGEWLRERGLLAAGEPVTKRDLDEAIQVREAIRALLAAQSGLPADSNKASLTLDQAAKRARLRVRVSAGAAYPEPEAPGVRGALGRLIGELALAQADGTWKTLRACRADDCRWAFQDTTKNHSRAWCSMDSCGNREKARSYRERHLGHGA